jgi:hypothetical protein
MSPPHAQDTYTLTRNTIFLQIKLLVIICMNHDDQGSNHGGWSQLSISCLHQN